MGGALQIKRYSRLGDQIQAINVCVWGGGGPFYPFFTYPKSQGHPEQIKPPPEKKKKKS